MLKIKMNIPHLLRSLLAGALLLPASPLPAQTTPALIPMPARMSVKEGKGLTLAAETGYYADDYAGDSIAGVVERWIAETPSTRGLHMERTASKKAQLLLKLNRQLAAEAYRLDVTPSAVTIEAARPAGFFYGLTTLTQLIDNSGSRKDESHAAGIALPGLTIEDQPRFGWRGFMLDEGRHFFGVEEVKRVLDMMARYKLNRFHWHLTEDQGWRIEIPKYPRLTTVGGVRACNRLATMSTPCDSVPTRGWYTEDEIRDVVAYARQRFIEIVPEIDIPGHSQAAIAAYPELLACDPEAPHEVWNHQGVSNDVINVARPEAVQWACDVLDEVCRLFPFGYIHLGGDECPMKKWKINQDCQAQLAQIGSTDYRDLQLHFYARLKKHLKQTLWGKDKQLIFWNEVLHGNTQLVGDSMTIMAWVGADAAALDAAQRGLNTILTPQRPYYINRKQSTRPTEPMSQGKGLETLEAVYAYDPLATVPESLQSRYLGVQANCWTEWVMTPSFLEYLLLPRLTAVAETAWTPQSLRSYPDYLERLKTEHKQWKACGWNYCGLAFGEE